MLSDARALDSIAQMLESNVRDVNWPRVNQSLLVEIIGNVVQVLTDYKISTTNITTAISNRLYYEV